MELEGNSGGAVLRSRRVIALSVVIFLVYLGFSIWRVQSTAAYTDALAEAESGSGNPLSDFYASSNGLVYGNYVVLFIFAFAISLCVANGVYKKDDVVLKWGMFGTVVCILVLVFTLANLFIVGDLCRETTTNCGELEGIFAASVALTILLLVLYFCSLYTTCSIYRSQEHHKVQIDMLRVSPAVLMASLVQQQPHVSRSDSIPYATPV